MPAIATLTGSLRRDSLNARLIATAVEAADDTVEFRAFEGLRDLPPFDEDTETAPPPAVAALRELIATADAVLIATPEYNGSVPGQLKNALDWASRPYATNPLRGKRVAIIGASPSPGGARRALADLRKILDVIGSEVAETEIAVPRAHESLPSEDDAELRTALRDVVDDLTRASRPAEAA